MEKKLNEKHWCSDDCIACGWEEKSKPNNMMTQGQNYRLKQIRAELEDFKYDRPDLKEKIEAVEAKVEKALLSSDEGDAWVIISNWYNYDWDNGNRESNLINFVN